MNKVKWIKILCIVIFLAHGVSAKEFVYPEIKNIHILTDNTTLKNDLEKFLSRYRGEPSSKETLDDIQSEITDYLSEHKYLQATLSAPNLKQTRTRKSTLSYTVNNPIQYHFIIRGNRQVQTSTLYKIINKENLLNHPSFTDIIQNQITEHYKSLAFNEIKIKTSLVKKSKYVHYIRLKLTEGQPFLIQNLKISGVTDKETKRYLDLFHTYATDSLKSNYYVAKEFESTLQKVVTHLRKRGFYNAVIYYKNIFYRQNKVFIEIIINERTPIKIEKIAIEGNRQFDKKTIQNIIELKSGDNLNVPKLEENISKLIQKYFEQGFLRAEINKEDLVQISKASKSAIIQIYISEGQKIYVKNIKVQGNNKISSDFIIHASSLKKGDVLTYKKIRQSRDFIEDLGLFTRIEIQPGKEDSVIISVQENTFNSLRFRLGVNTEHTLSGKILAELNTKNLFKDNNSQLLLNMEAQPNYRLLRNMLNLPSGGWNAFKNPQSIEKYLPYYLSGSYKRYYTLGSRWSGQISYSHANSLFSFTKLLPEKDSDLYLDSSERVEWLRSHTFSFDVERKFDLNTILTFKIWGLDLQSSYFQDFLFYSDKIHNHMTFELEEQTIIAETGLEVMVDRRDNRFFPRKGFQFESTLNYSSPYIGAHKDIHFIRAEAKHTYYAPVVYTNVIFAQSIHGGVVHRLNSGQVPVTRLFILGGVGSLRGYNGEYRGQNAHRVPSTKDLPIQRAVENKSYSSAYILLKNEIRIPLDKRLGFTLFYDGGFVFLHNTSLEQHHGHSIGIGLYGLTPLGIPAVINVGYRLNSDAHYDEYGNFSTIHTDFSIGFF
ncbi:MAG: BamA/TamA family outer membrane protein [Bdellovibrionales bacterium]|nr:BamA/TamA family outer membrane protein [Bdellovibrionales bacterium]